MAAIGEERHDWRSTGDPPPVPVRRFTVAEYRRLGTAGILADDDRVELLEGWIVPQMVHNPPHDNAIELAQEILRPELPGGWSLRVQSSVTLSDSEPEPDLAVVRGSARERQGRHPTAHEVGVVIEVADTSLERDRTIKARLYARARIPTYWIINLVERQVEVHLDPSSATGDPCYEKVNVVSATGGVELVLDGSVVCSVDVESLLP